MPRRPFMRDPSAALQQAIAQRFYVPEEGADPWPEGRQVNRLNGRRALMLFVDEQGHDERLYRLGQASVWAHPYWHGREQLLLGGISLSLPDGKVAQGADMFFPVAA